MISQLVNKRADILPLAICHTKPIYVISLILFVDIVEEQSPSSKPRYIGDKSNLIMEEVN